MTSHHAKFQLDSSKRSQVIPLQKSINNDNDNDTHPGWIIVRDGKYSVADKKSIDIWSFSEVAYIAEEINNYPQCLDTHLGSGPVEDDDLWYHHIPKMLRSLSLSLSPSPTLRASQLALPGSSRGLPAGSKALPAGY